MIEDAAEIARLSAEALWADDKASQSLGMEVLEVGPGRAKLAMRLTERMVRAGQVVGIRILDHLIVGREGSYSLADAGLM